MKNYLSGTVNGTSLESRDESEKSRDSQSGEDDKCSQKSYPLQDSSVVAVEVVPGPGPQLISEFLEEDLTSDVVPSSEECFEEDLPTVVCEEITATEATDLSVRLLEDVRDKRMLPRASSGFSLQMSSESLVPESVFDKIRTDLRIDEDVETVNYKYNY